MTAAVIADTGPLYALADTSDQYHRQAQEDLQTISEESRSVVVSYPVLCESYTLIVRRLGGSYARQWLDEIFESAVLVNPQPSDYVAAASLLNRYPDHPITLPDAVTAILGRRLHLHVWSFDRHFAIMGSKEWRKRR